MRRHQVFGWDSGYQYYLVPLVPFVMFNDRLKGATVWAASLAVLSAMAALRVLAPTEPMDPRIAWLTNVANLATHELLEAGLLERYRWEFLDRPPLNSSNGNWQNRERTAAGWLKLDF